MNYEEAATQAMEELSNSHPDFAVAFLALVLRIIRLGG